LPTSIIGSSPSPSEPIASNRKRLLITAAARAQPGLIVERSFPEQAVPDGTVVLPDLDRSERQGVVARFHDIVSHLTALNGDNELWWYTWLSTRDRLQSGLLAEMTTLARLEKLLADCAADSLIFTSAQPSLAAAAARRAEALGWQCVVDVRAPETFIARLRTMTGLSLRWIAAARRHPRMADLPRDLDLVIVSVVDRDVAPLLDGGRYRDSFFGDIGDYLARQSKRFAVLGMTYLAHDSNAAVHGRAPYPIVLMGHVVGLFDLVTSLFAALRFTARTDGLNRESAQFVADAVARSRPQLVLGSLMRKAVAKLLARNPRADVLHMFENNPWERGIAFARAAATPERRGHGYMHCAVLPAQTKNHIKQADIAAHWPGPDRVYCLGVQAARAYRDLSAVRDVRAGCTFRDQAALDVAVRPAAPSHVARILILLEGLPSVGPMIQFADSVARGLGPGIEWRVRCHPVLPHTEVSSISGVNIGDNDALMPSLGLSLTEDIARADLVLYQSSTAVFTAAMAAVPLVHFRTDLADTDDPLFAIDALKRSVDTRAEFEDAIAHFTTMGQDRFVAERSRLRDYVQDYLAMPSDALVAEMVDFTASEIELSQRREAFV
jgi:hypothetical protein